MRLRISGRQTDRLPQFGRRIRPLFQVRERLRKRRPGLDVVLAILDGLPEIRNGLPVLALRDQQISLEEKRPFVMGIESQRLIQVDTGLREVARELQMKCVLEIRPRGAGKSAGGAAGKREAGRKIARILVRLDRQQVQIRIVRLELQSASRQRRLVLEIAAFGVLHDHDLHQADIARLDRQRGPPGSQGVIAPVQAGKILAEQIARGQVVRLGPGRQFFPALFNLGYMKSSQGLFAEALPWLELGLFEASLPGGLLRLVRQRARVLRREQDRGRHGFRGTGSVLPVPSTSRTIRSAAEPGKRSAAPLGQRTRNPSTAAFDASPKCSLESSCDR